MSDSVRPHRRQPTRLPRPWDSPGKNTGVGCHSLLQCMKVKSESEVAQSCPTLHDSMDCSPPSPSVHGIFQARVLEWGVIAFSLLWGKLVNWAQGKAILHVILHIYLFQTLRCIMSPNINSSWKIRYFKQYNITEFYSSKNTHNIHLFHG